MKAIIRNGVFCVDGEYSTEDLLTIKPSGTKLTVKIDEPWAGDSETGFGRECSIDIDKETAAQLIEFLKKFLGDDT